jgi:hypothetical protein
MSKIPIPSKRTVDIIKQQLRGHMNILAPTVDTLLVATNEERHNVGCIEDAYHGLQDALEALEDITE